MKSFKKILNLAGMLALASQLVSTSQANLLVNGSFENGAEVVSTVFELESWTPTPAAGDSGTPFGFAEGSGYIGTDPASPPRRFAVLNGGYLSGSNVFPSSLSQTVTTVPGQTYELSFDAGVYSATSGSKTQSFTAALLAQPGDSVILSVPSSRTQSGVGASYGARQTISFVASSASTTIRFTSTSGTSSSDLLLDHVSLVQVVETNDPPVAVNDSYSTPQDTPLTVTVPGVLNNDTDADSDPLTAIKVTDPSNGSVTLNSNGSFTYTPNTSFNGTDSFTYKADDGEAESNTATVTINVTAPTVDLLTNGSFELGTEVVSTVFALESWTPTPAAGVSGTPFGFAEGSGYIGTHPASPPRRLAVFNGGYLGGSNVFPSSLSQTVTTVPGQTYELSFDAGVYSATSGSKTQNFTAALLAQPGDSVILSVPSSRTQSGVGASYGARQTISFVASSASTTILFTSSSGTSSSDFLLDHVTLVALAPGNSAPVAVADAYSTPQDTPLTVTAPGLLGNDTDADSDPLTAIKVTDPTNGSVTVNSNGSFTYTPNTNYTGPDAFTYKANDSEVDSAPATVTITVNDVNDPPVAVDDAYSTDEDTPLTVLAATGLLDNDTDLDLDPLTAIKVTDPANGSVTVSTDGSFTYTPNANYSGSDTFTYKANDSLADSSPATVTITVNAINDAPVAVADSYSTNEDTPLELTAPGVLANDTDVENNVLTAQVVTAPDHGNLTLNSNGSFTYDPDPGYSGPDSFTYRASDGDLNSNDATVSITVENGPPFVGLLNGSFELGAEVVATVFALESWTPAPAAGVSGTPFGFAEGAGPTGTDPASPPRRFAVFNGGYLSGSNVFPSSISQTVTTTPGQTYELSFDAGIYSATSGSKTQSFTAAALAEPGASTIVSESLSRTRSGIGSTYGARHTISFVASSTSTTIRFSSTAGTSGSDLLLDHVTLVEAGGGGNTAPVANSDAYSTDEDTPLTVLAATGLLDNDTDVDLDPLTAIKVTDPANGTVTINSNGGFTYTPNANYSGSDSFTYKANDGLADSAPAIVTITVNPINDAPIAVDDSYSVTVDTPLVVANPGVLANDTDPELQTLSATVVAAPSNGSVTLNPGGGFTYEPDPSFVGSDFFTYRANDGVLDSNVVTVSLTVSAPVGVVLLNGSFEIGAEVVSTVFALESWTPIPAAGVSGTPFGFSEGSGYTGTDPASPPRRFAVFNGGYLGGSNVFPSSLSQTITTMPGQEYELSFDAGIYVATAGSRTQSFTVAALSQPGGATIESASSSRTSSAVGTTYGARQTLTFTATTASTTILFTSTSGTSSSDFLLDNVQVSEVGANVAPVAVANSYSTNKNSPLVVSVPGVLANDTDANADTLTAIKVTDPANGSVTLNSNGSFTYTPNNNFVGSDSFTYKANDAELDSNTATVTIAVAENLLVNGSFELGEIVAGQVTNFIVGGNPTWEKNAGNVIGYIQDTGPGAQYIASHLDRMAVFNGGNNSFNAILKQTVTTVPGQAYQLIFDAGILHPTGTSGNIKRTQKLNVKVNGGATLLSKVEDLEANRGSTVWRSDITHTFIADGTSVEISFDDLLSQTGTAATQASSSDLLLDDVRLLPIANARTLTVASSPVSSLAVEVSPGDLGGALDGITSFTRLYADGVNVTLTATEASGASVFEKWQKNGIDFSTDLTTQVLMDADYTMNAVYVVDNNPRGTADSYSVDEDNQLMVVAPGVLGNDTEPNSLPIQAILVDAATNGSVSLALDGGFDYLPNPNFYGVDTFTYKVTNGTLESGPTTVTITVSPVNDSPSASPQTLETDEDTPVAVTLVGTDPDGDALTYLVSLSPMHGQLSGTGPNRTYTPNANFFGTDSFEFTVTDGVSPNSTAVVTINVSPISDPPVANAQSVTVTGATSAAITLTGNDPDGDPLTYTIISGPTQGVLNGTGVNRTYIPVESFVGSDSFTFTVSDGESTSPPATVSITVTGILLNGSFELGTLPNATNWTPASNLGGAVSPNNYEIKTSPAPIDGVRLAAFNTGGNTPNGVIRQTFATTPGRSYELKFDLGIHNFVNNASRTMVMRVKLTGSSELVNVTRSVSVVGSSTGVLFWKAGGETLTFVPNSASTTLEFTDVTSNSGSQSAAATDLLLDNVRITTPVTRQIAFESTPNSGVPITVTSPADINGATSGVTGFNRRYVNGTTVNFSAPAAQGAFNFQKWTIDGVDHSTDRVTSVVMNGSYTMTAVYIPNAAPVTVADEYSTNEDELLTVSLPGVLSNDTDPESVALTAELDIEPANGTLVLNPDGSFDYTPGQDFSGFDSFTYMASDGVVQSGPTLVTITVDPVNDLPLAMDDGSPELPFLTVLEESGPSDPINVLANDSDVESEPLTLIEAESAQGDVDINLDGSLTFTPAPNFAGLATITYTISDGNPGGVNSATVYVAVTNLNDTPFFNADPFSTPDATEDIAYVGNLAGTATDIDPGDILSFAKIDGPAWLNIASDGTLSGTPENSDVGPNSFTVRVTDLDETTDEATLTIEVINVNDDPVFTVDPIAGAAATQDAAYVGTLAGSATDIDADDVLTYTKVSGPAWLSVATDGTLSGTPDNSDVGPNSFIVRVTDVAEAFAEATLNIEVGNVNDDPVFTVDPIAGAAGTQDAAYVGTLVGSATDIDADDVLTYTKVSGPAWLSVATDGTLSGTPDNSDVGPNSFTVRVTDVAEAFAEATLNIEVGNVNDDPVFTVDPIAGAAATQDAAYVGTLAGSATDIDADDVLTYTKVSGPAWLSVATDGTLSGTPDNSDVGPNSFTVRVTDVAEAFAEATLNIEVGNVNDDPVFTVDPIAGAAGTQDAAYVGTLAGSATDIDADDVLTYTKVSGPAWLSVATDGTLSGTPDNSEVGPNSFTVRVTDVAEAFAEATLNIEVGNVNDDPVFTVDPIAGAAGTQDAAYVGTLAGSATDIDADDVLTYTKVSGPAWLSVATDGTLSGTPDNSDVGPNSFTVRVTDVAEAFAEATLNIEVGNVNDDPVFTVDPIAGAAGTQDAAYVGTLAGSATDIDADDVLTYTKVSGPAWLSVATDGTLSGTPDNSDVGPNSFTVRVTDVAEAFAEATLNIEVGNVNDDPVFTVDPIAGAAATQDAAYVGTLAGSATDIDADDVLTYTKVSGPAWLSVATDGTLSGTPDNSDVGPNSFTVRVTDVAEAFAEATLNIEVGNVNDDPVFTVDPIAGAAGTQDAAYVGTLAGSATDIDADDVLTYTKVSGPAWLSVATDGTLSGTPDNSDVGPNSFTVRVTDVAEAFAEATLNIEVGNVNDDPVFTVDPIAGAAGTQDAAYVGTLAGSATDIDADDVLTYTKVSGPAWLSVATDGTLSGTPDNSDVGPNSFTVRVTDVAEAFAEATLNIEVGNVNDDPVFTVDPIVGAPGNQSAAYVGTLAGSATDIDADDVLTYTKVSGPAWLSVATDGTLSGTPDNSDVGPNSFTVRVTDVAEAFAEATLNIEVGNVNDDPVFTVNPIAGAAATQDAAYVGTLAGSATDIDADDVLTYTKVSGPAWLSVATDGTLSGTPDNSDVGPNSFTVRVTDVAEAFAEATLNIEVGNVNDDPVFTVDPIAGAAATQDAAYVGTLAGSATDIDADDVLTYTKVSGPAWLSVATDGTLSGTPDNSDVGPNSFTVRVTDVAEAFAEATLNIEVGNVNDDPVFTVDPIAGAAGTQDAAYVGTLAGSATDIDADDVLTYTKVSGPAWLSVATDGTLSGTPDNSDVGPNSFTVRVTDVAEAFAEATLNIEVGNVNDDPVFTVDPIAGAAATQDAAYVGTLAGSATDIDADDVLTYTKVSGPAWLSVATDGTLSGTPDNSDVGPNSFTVRVTDVAEAFAEATLNIEVGNVNDDPVFTVDPIAGAAGTQDAAYVGTLVGSATDIDADDVLTYTKVSGPAWLSVATDGTLSGTPDNSDVGPNSFTVRVTDVAEAFAEATLNIEVGNVNDDPVFTVDPIAGAAGTQDAAYVGTLAGSATDIDADDVLTYTKVSGPAWLSVATDGTLSGTPDNSDVGPNSFTVRVTDVAEAFAEATLNIEVGNVNDDPVFTVDPIVGAPGNQSAAYVGTLAGSATDIDADDVLTYTKVSGPGWLEIATDGTLSGTPGVSDAGLNSFTVRVTDVEGAFDEASLEIEVTSSGFFAWLATYGVVAGPNVDSDKDGINNAVEYVIGGNPANQNNSDLLPQVSMVSADPDNNTVNEPYLLFTYRRTDLANSDPLTTIRVQWNTTLGGAWNDAAGTPGVVILETDNHYGSGIDRVRVYIPKSLAPGGMLFARMAVDINEVPANEAPVATPQSVTVDEDSSVPVTLTATDLNGDTLTYSIVTPPTNGALSGDAPNFTYTPDPNFSGADSFTFKASDLTSDSAPATVSLTVNPLQEFTQWLDTFGVTDGSDGDTDKDSIGNSIEWVIGGNPANQNDSGLLPQVSLVTADPDENSVDDDYMLFTYRRTQLAKNDPDTSIKVEWNTSLTGPWTDTNGTEGVVVLELINGNEGGGSPEQVNNAEPGVDLVQVYIPRSLSSTGKVFARLGVVVGMP